MRVARVAAQAKINLFLKVMSGPGPSGYHDVTTMFQRIDLADDVVVRVDVGERTIDATGPRVPASGLGPAEKNLAYRAAIAYKTRTGGAFPQDFRIEIVKNVPVGGGLGGGSADAAAVLRALDSLAPTPMDSEELRKVAASLGADIPFLTTDFVLAMGGGRGDIVVNAAMPGFPMPTSQVLLVVPRFGVATADAYRWLDEDRPRSWPPTRDQRGPEAIELQPASSLFVGYCREGNDFEPVVEKRHPELRAIRERLMAAGAAAARLSGSGSAVYGIFEGAVPSAAELGLDADVIRTRTSERVVPVEVLE